MGLATFSFLITNQETGKRRKEEKKEDITLNCMQTVIKDTTL